MCARLALLPLALLLAGGPAAGQTLRQVVVPADATQTVPPRGQALPAATRPMARPPVIPDPAPPHSASLAAAPMGLGAAPLLLLPIGAAALLGGSLAGSGSGSAAPAATR